MKIKFKDIMIVGFALFAMFFGAGNLIFPPYLGILAGDKWLIAIIAFLLTDAGLSLLVIISLSKVGGNVELLFERAGRNVGIIIGVAMVLCIGPFFAVPRTASTAYEIAILPSPLHNAINPIVFSIVYFAIVFGLTIKPSRVVDIIGGLLTPVLLICLAILIIKGVTSPLGQPLSRTLVDNVFISGINDGYQTMDAMGACVFATVVILSIKSKGYIGSQMTKATVLAGIVTVIGMALVYGGLAYLGSTVSSLFDASVERTELIMYITNQILGTTGQTILGIIISLACLTTAIGVTSSAGHYFRNLSHGKIPYSAPVIIICVFAAVVSNFGVDQIILFAGPILGMIYPAVVTYVIIGLFVDKITNNNVFRFAVWTALVLGIVNSLPGLSIFSNVGFLKSIAAFMGTWPGASIGFFWIVPVAIAAVIGHFVNTGNVATKPSQEIESV